MSKTFTAGLLAALTALALGCGGSDEGGEATPGATPAATGEAPETPTAGTTTIQGEYASEAAEIARGQLPQDYPSDLPVYPGAQPTTSMMVGGSGLIVLSSNAPVADVLAHYREALPSQGWTVDSVSEKPGRLSAHKESRSATISISEGKNGTEIGVALKGGS